MAEQDSQARVVVRQLIGLLEPLDLGYHPGGRPGQAGACDVGLDRLDADLELALIGGQEIGDCRRNVWGVRDRQDVAPDLIGQDRGGEGDADLRCQ